MFTLPRGKIGLRKTPIEVLSDLKSYKLYFDALTNTAVQLCYGWAGGRGASTVFSEIFVCRRLHLAFYIWWWTLWERVKIRSSPLEDPRPASMCRPLTFLRSPKKFDPTTPSKRSLRVTAGRETHPEATSMSLMLRNLWRGVLIRDFHLVWFHLEPVCACLIYYLSFYYY